MAIAPARTLRTPVDPVVAGLAPRIGRWRRPALLESGGGPGPGGRYSVLAARPRASFAAVGDRWRWRTASGVESGRGCLDALARILDRHRLADPADAPEPDAPPFSGGLIGSVGYDLAPLLERLPRRLPREPGWPDLRFGLYDSAVVVDHEAGRADLWTFDLLDEGPAAVESRHARWLRDLARPVGAVEPSSLGRIVAEQSRAEYLARVGRVLEYIRAGDIFQANYAQRFSAAGRVDPLELYRRLRRRSPAPFAAFLGAGDRALIGASPEWFYRTDGPEIVTRPIKGTRPRGADAAEDARLVAELRASPKDRAELTMIVDLERNDLGRVGRFGSVRVDGGLAVESFAEVHHLVATVRGSLRPGLGPVDVLRAVFPGGSITGAPKIRAMEIIDELEPSRRGPYTGMVGYFSRGGTSAFNIAIRTIVAGPGRVSYHVGGGIVADSDPEAEYRETLDKGRGLRDVIEGWGLDP